MTNVQSFAEYFFRVVGDRFAFVKRQVIGCQFVVTMLFSNVGKPRDRELHASLIHVHQTQQHAAVNVVRVTRPENRVMGNYLQKFTLIMILSKYAFLKGQVS